MAENGAGQKDEIIIRLVSRTPWVIQIDGEIENLNLALAMLAEATRSLEMEWRLAAAQEHQAKRLAEAQQGVDVSNLLSMDLKKLQRRH